MEKFKIILSIGLFTIIGIINTTFGYFTESTTTGESEFIRNFNNTNVYSFVCANLQTAKTLSEFQIYNASNYGLLFDYRGTIESNMNNNLICGYVEDVNSIIISIYCPGSNARSPANCGELTYTRYFEGGNYSGNNWSALYINEIQHEGAETINITIPEEINRNYTGDLETFELNISGYNVDTEYITNIIEKEKATPGPEDIEYLIQNLGNYIPLLCIAGLMITARYIIKKVFK